MDYLREYISEQNLWRRVKRRPELQLEQLTAADVQELHEQLECDLSPENLTRDGELRGTALLQRANYLQRVQRELSQVWIPYEGVNPPVFGHRALVEVQHRDGTIQTSVSQPWSLSGWNWGNTRGDIIAYRRIR